jgi:hypothetical protein
LKPKLVINYAKIFLYNRVYETTSRERGVKYTGKTRMTFKIRYEEHLLSFRNGNTVSNFAEHLFENVHAFGKIEGVMKTLRFSKNIFFPKLFPKRTSQKSH